MTGAMGGPKTKMVFTEKIVGTQKSHQLKADNLFNQFSK